MKLREKSKWWTRKLGERGGPARTIGEIRAGAEPAKQRRTGQPVRRDSYNVGEREARWYRPVARASVGARLMAAERYELRAKVKGRKNGAFGHVGLEVLKLLYRTVCFKTGRLEPSLDWMMLKLRRSRAAIVRALQALQRHGFIDWIRRTEPTDIEGPGPQVRQISNAYRLLEPACPKDGHFADRPPPIPDDHAHAVETAAAERAAMVAGLTPAEYVTATIADDSLAGSLSRLADALGFSSASSPESLNPSLPFIDEEKTGFAGLL